MVSDSRPLHRISLGFALSALISWAGAAPLAWADEPSVPPDTAPPSLAPDTPPPPVEPPQPEAETSTPPPVPEIPEPTPPSTAEAEKPHEAEAAPQRGEDSRQENVVNAKRDGQHPYYQMVHPNWGVSLTASIGALGGTDIIASQAGSVARALEIQAEYQPAFLQSIGVLGVGPCASIIPIGADGTVTNSPLSVWSVGGQVRYQARYFREQPVVPYGGFEVQYVTYHFADGNSGGTLLMGPYLGGMFLLNILEPSSAAELYIEDGIARSYLVAEYKLLGGEDGIVSIDGGSLFFGLRFEF